MQKAAKLSLDMVQSWWNRILFLSWLKAAAIPMFALALLTRHNFGRNFSGHCVNSAIMGSKSAKDANFHSRRAYRSTRKKIRHYCIWSRSTGILIYGGNMLHFGWTGSPYQSRTPEQKCYVCVMNSQISVRCIQSKGALRTLTTRSLRLCVCVFINVCIWSWGCWHQSMLHSWNQANKFVMVILLRQILVQVLASLDWIARHHATSSRRIFPWKCSLKL